MTAIREPIGRCASYRMENGDSDRFIDAIVNLGDAAMVKAQLKAHFDAGATHVCLQPIHEEGNFAARDHTLKALADA